MKAVQAIRPPLEQMLSKGVGKLRLQAKLVYWRVRFRLTGLALGPDGAIKAKVNPEDEVARAQNAKIGRALEPILIKVEAQLLKNYRRSRGKEKTDPKASRKAAFLPERAKFTDIETVRDIRTKGTALSKVLHTMTGGKITIFDVENLARFFVPGPGSYKRMAASGLIPSAVTGDTLAMLERARRHGMAPAMDVAQAMQGAGLLSKEEIVHGAFNPMREVGASKAADISHFGGSFFGEDLRKAEGDGGRRRRRDVREHRADLPASARAGETTEHRHPGKPWWGRSRPTGGGIRSMDECEVPVERGRARGGGNQTKDRSPARGAVSLPEDLQ
jgi:hypothetical protein